MRLWQMRPAPLAAEAMKADAEQVAGRCSPQKLLLPGMTSGDPGVPLRRKSTHEYSFFVKECRDQWIANAGVSLAIECRRRGSLAFLLTCSRLVAHRVRLTDVQQKISGALRREQGREPRLIAPSAVISQARVSSKAEGKSGL